MEGDVCKDLKGMAPKEIYLAKPGNYPQNRISYSYNLVIRSKWVGAAHEMSPVDFSARYALA
jgi:hypothetical protein